jgi:hypothetical protein
VVDWAKGKSEADVVAAINGGDTSPVGQALSASKNDVDFFYSRNTGAGLIKMMQVCVCVV